MPDPFPYIEFLRTLWNNNNLCTYIKKNADSLLSITAGLGRR
jgi:hypothetical protein